MNIEEKKPPRKFTVGHNFFIDILDCGKIYLDDNEMITFVTKSGKNYDVVAKDWGFYATPSINSRLSNEGFKTALVRNIQGRYYIMLVEREGLAAFEKYIKSDNSELIEWLDER
jgi:hypothetical protein